MGSTSPFLSHHNLACNSTSLSVIWVFGLLVASSPFSLKPLMGHTGNMRDSFKNILESPFICGLEWEKEYYTVFKNYARRIVKAIYGDNEDEAGKLICNDEALQEFYKSFKYSVTRSSKRLRISRRFW